MLWTPHSRVFEVDASDLVLDPAGFEVPGGHRVQGFQGLTAPVPRERVARGPELLQDSQERASQRATRCAQVAHRRILARLQTRNARARRRGVLEYLASRRRAQRPPADARTVRRPRVRVRRLRRSQRAVIYI